MLKGKIDLHQDIKPGPYKDLYIYHIKGHVRDMDEQSLGECFIGNWVEDNSSFLFFWADSNQVISEFIKTRSDLELLDDYYFTFEEWQGEGTTTIRIDKFVIMNPWAEVETKAGDIKILLDPGVVFGNGLHPTTRDCLKAIYKIYELHSVEKVLDLGTGTGILAISAAALGAKEILAVDLNPLSVKTAMNNVRLNGFEERIEVVRGLAEDYVHENVDLVIANIHYEVVRSLFEQKKSLENKMFIISGLMRSQARDIKGRIKEHGLIILNEWDHEMTWYTFLMRKV